VRLLIFSAGVLAVGLLLVSGLPSAGSAPSAPPGPSLGATLDRAAAPAAPRPAAGVTNVTIGPAYNSTEITPPAPADRPCYWENYTGVTDYAYCEAQTQSPTLVSLSSGNLGLGFSVYTTIGPLCNATGGTNLTSWTVSSVAWTHSTTNGTTWAPWHVIGSVNCQYPASSEPSFASGAHNAVYGAFVASNQTLNTSTAFGGQQPSYPMDWNDSANATLAFLNSSDNGNSWSAPSLVPGVLGVARPQVAVFGTTVYVVYIHVPQNVSTSVYPVGQYLGYSPALSVQIVYTTDSGTTWHGPYTLPGENASMGNWSSSPSLAVTASGTVAVAYATNRSCVESCAYGSYASYADRVVVATSPTNGSTWNGPVTVATDVGETTYFPDFYDNYVYGVTYAWQIPLETSIAIAPNGTSFYVAYAGAYYYSALQSYYNWFDLGVFAAVSNNGGANWTDSTVQLGNVMAEDNVYNPAIAVEGGKVYIAYVWMNGSSCNLACNPYYGGYSAWLAVSSNGTAWQSIPTGAEAMPYDDNIDSAYQGFTSSLAFDRAGRPVSATTLAGQELFRFAGRNGTVPVYRTTDEANVTIGFEVSTAPGSLKFVEHNLSAGTTWGVTVDGYQFTSNRTAIDVTNAPRGVGLLLGILPQPSGYREIEVAKGSLPSYYVLNGSATDDIHFGAEYGLVFALEPLLSSGMDLTVDFHGQFFDLDQGPGYSNAYPNLPWYFPVGSTIPVLSAGLPPVTYWNGTGNGSFTGPGRYVNLTILSPINETAWGGSYGVYDEPFLALGLPAGAPYAFDFDGATHNGTGGNDTIVANVSTGAYTVSDVHAGSNRSGWEYFGGVTGGSDVVVVPDVPLVTLTFAFVDVAAPTGTVTFHADGIGNGTVWSVAFNGTTYSASSPWLNVSTKPGTYPWSVGSAVAKNASAGYAPVGIGSTVSVTTGATVTINYTSAYRVDVVAGLGGVVSTPGNHWVAAGTNASYTAAASNGYQFAGWTGTGSGSYSGLGTNGTATIRVGGAITETASFYPLPNARFNLTFLQSGIPSGVWWTVYLNGVGYSSNGTQLEVNDLWSCAAGAAGQYSVAVPQAYDNATQATRYGVIGSVPSQLCTNGGLVQPLVFGPQYEVSVTATAGGTAYLANRDAESNESVWASPNDTVLLTALPDTGYTFGGWNGTGTGSYTGGSLGTAISVGTPVSEFATFVPVAPVKHPAFHETFVSSVKFPTGTTWSVTINGSSYAANGPSVTVYGLQVGPYTAEISTAVTSDGLTKWAPVDAKMPVTVSGNGTTPVPFGKASYWVSIAGTAGGTVAPASGWQVAGTSLTLNASPILGYQFVNWSGSGDGSVNGTAQGPTVTVLGPISEVATFAPVPTTTTVASTVWQSPGTLAVLALVGLLAGLVVGIAVRRLRAAPAAPPNASGPGGPPGAWSGPNTDPNAPSGGNP
jgi:hypothetical protein